MFGLCWRKSIFMEKEILEYCHIRFTLALYINHSVQHLITTESACIITRGEIAMLCNSKLCFNAINTYSQKYVHLKDMIFVRLIFAEDEF